jgi:predicted ABC-type ATPase
MPTVPRIILLAGPNGAGKTTLAPCLLRDRLEVLEYVNADTIAEGLAAFSPEQVAMAAGRIMLRRLRELAKARRSFAFESTLAARAHAPWIASLVGKGYAFELLFLWLQSADLAVQRVRQRARNGGHWIEEAVVRRRYIRGNRNFFKLYSPLAARWVVYDNSSPGKPLLIATGARTRASRIHQPELWKTFRETAS